MFLTSYFLPSMQPYHLMITPKNLLSCYADFSVQSLLSITYHPNITETIPPEVCFSKALPHPRFKYYHLFYIHHSQRQTHKYTLTDKPNCFPQHGLSTLLLTQHVKTGLPLQTRHLPPPNSHPCLGHATRQHLQGHAQASDHGQGETGKLGVGTKTLTGITISQAVEATRNVPSPEKTHNLCLHVSICSLRREKTVVKTNHLTVEMHKEETNISEQISKGCKKNSNYESRDSHLRTDFQIPFLGPQRIRKVKFPLSSQYPFLNAWNK